MTRAESWSGRVGYSLVQSFTNRYGTYRRDCSGFVSMAWALGSSYSTWTLPRVAHRLTKAGLRRGDILLHRPSSGYGHVVIFDRWANRRTAPTWPTSRHRHRRQAPHAAVPVLPQPRDLHAVPPQRGLSTPSPGRGRQPRSATSAASVPPSS